MGGGVRCMGRVKPKDATGMLQQIWLERGDRTEVVLGVREGWGAKVGELWRPEENRNAR